MSFAIIRGSNGRRHEVDFGDAEIEVDVAISSETVQITVEAVDDLAPSDKIMRSAVMAAMVSAALLSTGTQAAETAASFIGLWEVVDPQDGSLTQRSITCDQEDVCKVLGPTASSLCATVRGASSLAAGQSSRACSRSRTSP